MVQYQIWNKTAHFTVFVSTVHKHAKLSVGKWVLETTHPHKHVQILKHQMFLPCFSQHESNLFEVIEYFRFYN